MKTVSTGQVLAGFPAGYEGASLAHSSTAFSFGP